MRRFSPRIDSADSKAALGRDSGLDLLQAEIGSNANRRAGIHQAVEIGPADLEGVGSRLNVPAVFSQGIQ